MLKNSKYSKLFKQYKVYLIIMGISIVYGIILFSMSFISSRQSEGAMNAVQRSIATQQGTLSSTEQKIQTLNAQLGFQNIVSNVSSNQYDSSNMKKFIAAYNTLLFTNSSVNQVVYSYDEKSSTLTATLSIDGSYSDVRNLIYYIESHFYFVNVKDVSLYSSEGSIRGSVVMDIYFRDGSS